MNTFTFIENYQGFDPCTEKAHNGPVYRGVTSDGRTIIIMKDVYDMNQPEATKPDDYGASLDGASAWIELEEDQA